MGHDELAAEVVVLIPTHPGTHHEDSKHGNIAQNNVATAYRFAPRTIGKRKEGEHKCEQLEGQIITIVFAIKSIDR